MKISKKTVILAIAVIVGIIAYRFYFTGGKSEIKFVTAPVEKGSIVSSILATGTLKPTKQINIHYETNGVVKNTYADLNDEVKKGETLAVIENSGSKARLNQAEAALRKSRSDYQLNKDNLSINKNLYEKRLISKEEFDNSLSAYRASAAQLEESRAELEQAKLELGKTRITSSLNGIVLEKNIIEGQKLYADNSDPIFTIAEDLSTLTLVSNISEGDIGRLSEGNKVNFTVDAYPDHNFTGEVSKILNSPKSQNNVVTYDVLSTVENKEKLLKPGMTAEVEIIISEKDNILKIPTAALRFIPPENMTGNQNLRSETVIWSVKGNALESHKIKTGISDDEYTEIEGDSIEEGKEILTEYYYSNTGDSTSGGFLPQPKRF